MRYPDGTTPQFPRIAARNHRSFSALVSSRRSTEGHRLRKTAAPLVHEIRKEVKVWRDNSYSGATETSKALLNWWFNTPHPVEEVDGTMSEFQYYFAQREALETIIYLYEVPR